jgi:hypothetical protein
MRSLTLCCHQAKGEDPEIVSVVDQYRAKYGLCPLRDCKHATLLEQQKEETVEALAKVSSLEVYCT